MTLDDLHAEGQARHLAVRGALHEGPDTIILLGPDEPGFWPAFTDSDEFKDRQPDPMDRWSKRVIGTWAAELNARAVFPSDGPPYPSFFAWAQKSGRAHPSPILFLAHDTAGLFISYRGALILSGHLALPPSPPNPCLTCADQPCLSACPVNAFTGTDYDVPSCKSYLRSDLGQTCMSQGCAARRACPVSQSFPRLPDQSAFHMKAFL